MGQSTLRRYIRHVLEDVNARVPTQLIDPDDAAEEADKDDEVDEFASVAGAMGGSGLGGFTAPGAAKRRKVTEVIRKCGGKWCLFSKSSGKKLGTHDSKEEAQAQERAIHAHGG